MAHVLDEQQHVHLGSPKPLSAVSAKRLLGRDRVTEEDILHNERLDSFGDQLSASASLQLTAVDCGGLL